ncbi:hypothetical protein BZF66_06770 [Salmonella enterica]|nr:hypothetical protein [Salmonella enterica]EHX8550451.1 hypothetical protein [Salmonella enterica]ELL7856593.1 hypothetical protein [Salmonella enterica]MCP0435764.1 hypothetical protein [Salmonella enterica subsp. enterica serovar Mbandaka]
MTEYRYCLMYSGQPIEGFSSSNGYPIFSVHDKVMPTLSFTSFESAQSCLEYMLLESFNTFTIADLDYNKLSVGMIEVKFNQMSHISAFDSVFKNALLANNTIALAKILHKCVQCGFRKILPMHCEQLMTNPQILEIYEKNVPYYVQQNMERFMDVGISTCTPEEFGAIILTTSDELLTAIQLDRYNKVSK